MKTKKIFVFMLILILILSLGACGNSSNSEASETAMSKQEISDMFEEGNFDDYYNRVIEDLPILIKGEESIEGVGDTYFGSLSNEISSYDINFSKLKDAKYALGDYVLLSGTIEDTIQNTETKDTLGIYIKTSEIVEDTEHGSKTTEYTENSTTNYKTDYFGDLSYRIAATWQPQEYGNTKMYGTTISFSKLDSRNEYNTLKDMVKSYMKNTMKSEKENGNNPSEVSLEEWTNGKTNGIMAIWDSDSTADTMRTYDLFIDYKNNTYSITFYGKASGNDSFDVYEKIIMSINKN